MTSENAPTPNESREEITPEVKGPATRPTASTINDAQLDALYATNQRLNLRAQQLESELATYRKAVGQWDVSERGTYIPHDSLRAIGKAGGVDILGSVRHLKHFERVEQAEAAVARVRNLADRIQQGVPWTANADDTARHIHAALDGPTATLVPRDPCPRCEDCRLIPRAEMAQHQRDHHPETVDAAPDRLAQSGVRTPGSTAEQLPLDILTLIPARPYLSTACDTAQLLAEAMADHPDRIDEINPWRTRLHNRCRRNQKFTGQLCVCGCHQTEEQ